MKVQNPIIGRARGSAGGMTFCKTYDKNVARAKAFEVPNPNTQAQQTQREFFKQVIALAMDFSDEQLRFLFPSKTKTMSRRNALSKQFAQSYLVDGTYKSVDFADIDTLGNAPTMDFGETTCVFSKGAILVTIDRNVITDVTFPDMSWTAAIVNETAKQILLVPEVQTTEIDNKIFTIPSDWKLEDSIHAIPMLVASKDKDVPLVGFGTMSVAKRPAHK